VDYKPLFHPIHNWSIFQKHGGDPKRHEAFPLGHIPFEESQFGVKDLVGTGKTVVSNALAKLPLHQYADKFVTIYDEEKGEFPIEDDGDKTPISGKGKGKVKLAEDNEAFWDQYERKIGFEDDDEFIFTVTDQGPSAHESRGITKLKPRQRFHHSHHHQAAAAAAKQGLQLIHGNSGNKEGRSSQQSTGSPAFQPTVAGPSKFDFSTNLASIVNASAPTFGRSASEISTSSNLNVNAPSFESPMSSFTDTALNALGIESPSKKLAQLDLNVAALQNFGRSASPAAASGRFNANAPAFRASTRPYSPGLSAARSNPDQPYVASQFRLRSRSPVKQGSLCPGKSGFIPNTNIPNLAYHSKTYSVGSQDARNYASYDMQAGGYGDVPSLTTEYNPALFQHSPHQRTTSRFMSSNMFGNTQMSADNSFSAQQSQNPYYQGANYGSQQNLSQYGVAAGMGSGSQHAQGDYNSASQHFDALSQQLEYTRRMYPSQIVNQAVNASGSGYLSQSLHASGSGYFSAQGHGHDGQSYDGHGI
jgi:hypothetical protein